MKNSSVVNYKVGFEGQYKRFAIDTKKINFSEFTEKCRKAFGIKSEETILVNFQENDKFLIIRNEVDFTIAIHSNVYSSTKSISFQISTAHSQNKLPTTQLSTNTFTSSYQKEQEKGGQSDVKITKKNISIILEKGFNHPQTQVILNNIADSIPLSQEKIIINPSSISYLIDILQQKIIETRSMRQQYQLIPNNLNGNNIKNDEILNKTLLQSTNYEMEIKNNITTPTSKEYDLSDDFNASISCSTQNLKQSFENIFQQFNQSIQQMQQSMRASIHVNKQVKKGDSIAISNGQQKEEPQKKVKTTAFDQFTMLNEYLDNIDSIVQSQGKQLIEDRDQENVIISALNDQITNIQIKQPKIQYCDDKPNPQTNLFDGIVKHVNHDLDQQFPAPFSETKVKSEESTYQKIYC